MKFFLIKFLLTTFCAFYCLDSYSQSKFSVSGIVDIGRSYRNIQILDEPSNQQLAEQVKEKRDITEKPAFAYSFGALVSYRLSKNFSITSGSIYKSLAVFTPRIPNCWPGPAPNCFGLFVSRFPGSMYHEGTDRWNYLSIPLYLGVKRNINDTGTLKLMINFGPSVDILINHQQELQEWDTNENTHYTSQSMTDWFNPVLFTLQGSAGVLFELNSNNNLGLSLYYNQSLSPIVENSLWFNETMYSYGVRLLINRNF